MQQVNLYQPARYAKARPTALLGMVGLLALGVVAVGGYYSYGAWQLGQARALAETATAQRAELEAQRESLRQRLAGQRPSPVLQAEVTRLTRERAVKAEVLAVLTGDEAGNRQGFSRQLEGLARRPVSGLWLTGITLRASGRALDLSGSATAGELLPQYLEGLRQEAALAGYEFRVLRMDRPEEASTRLDFELRSEAAEGE